jgi:hypothetical protein
VCVRRPAARLCRLVKAHVQQRQKGHVVAETEPCQLAAAAAKLTANAAIYGGVAAALGFIQFPAAGRHIAEHKGTSFAS